MASGSLRSNIFSSYMVGNDNDVRSFLLVFLTAISLLSEFLLGKYFKLVFGLVMVAVV